MCDCRLERDSTWKRAQGSGLITVSNLASVSRSEAFCSLAPSSGGWSEASAAGRSLFRMAVCLPAPCQVLRVETVRRESQCFFSPHGSSSFRFSRRVRCQRLTVPTVPEGVVFVKGPARPCFSPSAFVSVVHRHSFGEAWRAPVTPEAVSEICCCCAVRSLLCPTLWRTRDL